MPRRKAPGVRRIAAAAIVLLMVIAAVRIVGLPRSAARENLAGRSGRAVPVELVTVREEPVQDTNVLSAQIEPYRVVTVSAEAADRVVERPVQAGQRVSAGQVLAILDSSTASNTLQGASAATAGSSATVDAAEQQYLQASIETASGLQSANAQLAQALANERKVRSYTRPQELKTARAALDEAAANERLARLHVERTTFLEQRGVVPQERLDAARTALATAVGRRETAEEALSLAQQGARPEDIEAAAAQVEAARAAVRAAGARTERLAALRRQIDALKAQRFGAGISAQQAQIALRRHRITAPFAGRVLATLIQPGEMTAPGGPIARIGDISRVKVSFAAPEASRPALRLGQPVSITVDALPGRHFSGKITSLAYQADPRSRTFPVEITVENPDEALLPNMLARVTLPVGHSRGRLLIPAGAVASDGGSTFVYVVVNGRALRREVSVIPGPGGLVEVDRGLSLSEQVAATPQRLSDGAAVEAVLEP